MKADNNHIEQLSLDPDVESLLADAMATNQQLLMTAEERVRADIEAACKLVGIENCQEPPPKPGEQRSAAFVILITFQQKEFGETGPTTDNPAGFTLANTTADSLILVRENANETRTLLHVTSGAGQQLTVSKSIVNPYEGYVLSDLATNPEDMQVIVDTVQRLRRVNEKWWQLLHSEERPEPPQPQVPLPRIPSPLED